YACVRLSSGERLAGQLADAALDRGMAFRPEFLDENAAPAQVATDEIERFEPARTEAPAAGAPEFGPAVRFAPLTRPGLGTPHGILLQSGEGFRARLLKLDDANVLFLLPGGVELKLPRQVLRKIDLLPEAPDPGELPAPTAVAENEDPGVDFKRREAPKKDEGAPKPEPKEKAEEKKKKKDVLQTTQELEPLKNAEILEADLRTGDLKIKDENGEWTIGMAPVRTLVFPKDPNAKPAAAKFRDWVLTLREGSRFEIALRGITPETITAEMAGGTVTLPLHVIDSIERRKK
ncbi:MAG: hypothetical protein NTW87_22495, partial [Planctomycetota bacterium]|nr:hypothetical protein [Planctomycetota bacterium]